MTDPMASDHVGDGGTGIADDGSDGTAGTVTLGELRSQCASQLAAAGLTDAATCAQWITSEAAGCSLAELVLQSTALATNRTVAAVDAMTQRRATGEPLQYVLGRWAFRSLDLAVDARALIPRPETETIAGAAINHLQQQAARSGNPTGGSNGEAPAKVVTAGGRVAPVRGKTGSPVNGRPNGQAASRTSGKPVTRFNEKNTITTDGGLTAVDLGTGCGAIALSIAAEVPDATVYATDVCDQALELARENLAGIGMAGARVQLASGDWFAALPRALAGNVDALVANPPYIAAAEPLPPSVEHYEPQLALRAGERGNEALEHLVVNARQWLRPGGAVVLECAPKQTQWLRDRAEELGFDGATVLTDTAGQQRGIEAHRPHDDPAATDVTRSAAVLDEGGFVVAPTDTVCGVLASWHQPAAVQRVYEAKRRPSDQAVPILVSGLRQANELVELNEQAAQLARQFWPGALTLVAATRDASRAGQPYGSPADGTLAVRVPAVGWLRWLADRCGPLTGTSANLHGAETPAVAAEAARRLAAMPSRVVAGRAPLAEPSTIVDATGPEPVVVRAGAVAEAEILTALSEAPTATREAQATP